MNKTDLIAAIADAADLSRADAAAAVNALTETITRALTEGDKVTIPGFGSFSATQVPSRMVRNPATGKSMRAKKSVRIKFSAGTPMKEIVVGRARLPKPKRRA